MRSADANIIDYRVSYSHTSINEAFAISNVKNGAMVAYDPILTTDTYAAYQAGNALYDPTTRSDENGSHKLPEDWVGSYYWSFDALSNDLRNVNAT